MNFKKILAVGAVLFLTLQAGAQSLYLNDHCEQAESLALDSVVRFSLGLPCLDTNPCEDAVQGVWYVVTGNDRLMEIVVLDDHDENVFFHIVGGDCMNQICLSNDNNRFFAEAGKTYHILVAKALFTYGENQVHFVVRSQMAAPYDQCEGALTLACDSLYEIYPRLLTQDREVAGCVSGASLGWLALQGDGQIKKLEFTAGFFNEISYQVFENDCGNLTCIYRGEGTEFQLATVPGKNYLIGVTHENLQLNIPILVRMSCRDNDLNTTCVNAEVLDCGDVVNATLTDSLPIDLVNSDIGSFPGLWYTLPNDSVRYSIRLTSPAIENLVIAIFKVRNGDCVNETTLFQYNPFPLGEDSYVVDVQPGESVFVKVAYFTQPTTFRLSVACFDLENNTSCSEPIAPACDEFINFYGSAQGELWLTLEGRDEPYELVSNGVGGSYRFDIFINDCDSLVKVKTVDFFIFEPNGLVLDLPPGQTYYIKAYPILLNFLFAEMWLNCTPHKESIFCEFAKPVQTDSTYSFVNYLTGVSLEEDPCGTSEGMWFTFTGNDSIVEMVLNSPFQKYSIYTGRCDSLVCFGGQEFYSGFQSFRFLAESGVPYFIKFFELSTFNEITFRLNAEARAYNAECQRADTLSCGENVVLPLGGTDRDLSDHCPGGWGLWYLVKGNNELWRIHTPGPVDIRLFENDCFSTSCLASGERVVSFFADSNSTYYIKVNSALASDMDMFAICYESEKNTCELASDVGCGDTLSFNFDLLANLPGREERGFNVTGKWYTYESDGQSFGIENVNPADSVSLYIEVREEDCEDTVYSGLVTLEDKAWLFAGDSGVVYKILVASPKRIEADFIFSCVETPAGFDCENALPINCGTPFAYSSTDRALAPVYDLYGAAWYTWEGNGDVVHVDLLDPVNGLGYAYRLFEDNGSCENLTLLSDHNGNAGPFYFSSETGKKYYLLIGLTNDELVAVDWTFQTTCFPVSKPNTCDQALSLECNLQYMASTLSQEVSAFGSCGIPTPGAWFTLEGDDQDYTIELTGTYDYVGGMQILLGEGDCAALRCLESADLTPTMNSITFTALSGRNYFLKFEGAGGAEVPVFDFAVYCKNQVENDSCVYAVPLACGDQISASLVNLESDDNNACSDLNQGLYYAISGNGEEIALTFDAATDQAYAVSVFENSCGTDGICLYREMVDTFRNKIQFLSKDSTAYFIKIAAGNQSTTTFDMSISCTEPPVNGNCEKAIQLQCQDTVDMSLVTPLGFTGETPCHFTEDARVYWYQLPKTDKIMSVNILEGQEAAHYIALISGTCNNLTCEAFFDINSDDIVLNTPEDFNYYLAIHGDAASVHGLKFVLECLDRPNNDACSNPTPIQCGDTIATDLTLAAYTPYIQDGCVINPWKDIWYQFTGNGEIMELVFVTEENFGGYVNLFLAGDCNALSCIENGPWRNNTESSVYRFLTEEGQDYLFSIQHPVGDSLEFTLRCTPLAANDACEGAFDWVFGDTTSVSLAGSLGDATIPCYDNQRDGVWYTFEGDGGYVYFAAADTTALVMNYVLMEGNCDDLLCLDKGAFGPNFELEFRTGAGSQYYLLVYGNGGLITSYQGPVMDNLVCSQAKAVACNDIVVLQSRLSLPDLSGSGCPGEGENSGWYKYTGTGDIVNLDFSTSGVEGSLEILLACDDTCVYKHALDTLLPESLSFLGVEGVDYLLKLNISRRIPDQLLIMEIGCEEGPFNYNQASAIELACDTFDLVVEEPYLNFVPECYDADYITYWYHFEGNDSLFTVTDSFPAGFTAFVVDANCNEILALTADSLSLLTEAGQDYFLVVRHLASDTVASFTFGINYRCIIIGSKDVDKNKDGLTASPNPFADVVTIEVESAVSEDAVLEMYDSQGKSILTKNWRLQPGRNVMTLHDWVHVPAGIYVVSLSGERLRTLVLIKE